MVLEITNLGADIAKKSKIFGAPPRPPDTWFAQLPTPLLIYPGYVTHKGLFKYHPKGYLVTTL